MQLVEVQLSHAVLQIGRPAAFDPLFKGERNRATIAAILSTLAHDRAAMAYLRRRWDRLGSVSDILLKTDAQLLKRLHEEIVAHRLVAVVLHRTRREIGGADLSLPEAEMVHIRLPGATILVAASGKLPHAFLSSFDNGRAASLIAGMNEGMDESLTLDRYAFRLPGYQTAVLQGGRLRSHLVERLRNPSGDLDAAVLSDPHQRMIAAGRADAPVAVARLDQFQKIFFALRLTRPLLRNDFIALYDKLTEWENIRQFIAMSIVFIALQYVPILDVIVDIWVLYELVKALGKNAIKGAKLLGKAAALATEAQSERQLRAAATAFKDSFEAFGVAGLSYILARLQANRVGGKLDKMAESSVSKPAAATAPAERTGSSKANTAAESAESAAAARAKLFETKPDEATFWSGLGRGGDKTAAEIASKNGGKTLEQVLAERKIDMPVWDADNPASVQAWKDASRMFAEGAKGDVTAVLGKAQRPNSIWNEVELPALKNNPDVTSISVLDPETGTVTKIFTRSAGP